MYTRLWQAVVGVGLAMGATGSGCLGKAEVSQPVQAGDDAGGQADVVSADVTEDSGHRDADALPPDVLQDALCDTSWPTTKGNPGPPPSCEDQLACAGAGVDAGVRPWPTCASHLGERVCDSARAAALCISGAWACPPGYVDARECWCWGDLSPIDFECTPSGWLSREGGASDAGGGGHEEAAAPP